MRVLIEVRNRDEKNAIEKMIRGLTNLGYSDLGEYAWRDALVASMKVSINQEVAATQLPTYNVCCQCIADGFTYQECDCDCHKVDAIENGANENGEVTENGEDEDNLRRNRR